MATLTTTVLADDPSSALGGNGGTPPTRDRGGDDNSGSGPLHFDVRLRRARLGMVAAMMAIVMVFVSFSSAYLVRQGLPTLDLHTNTLVSDWIPVPLPRLLLINTFVLLLSTLTMALARRQTAREAALTQIAAVPEIALKREAGIQWLGLTVLLGFTFLTGQWRVWHELAARGFYLNTSPSSSFIYLLTGTHGVHLLGGVLALVAAGGASLLRRPVTSRLVVLDVTAWYWHFMAFLWIYILCLLEFAR
ncbi:MAG: heme-copper oxidase subunit III [Candidatus Acidiferrales bacterium]